MRLHFTYHSQYHSQTQRVLHGMPFVLLVCGSGWLLQTSDGNNELAQIGALLGFGWWLLANLLMSAMIRYRGARFGPIDLSKNVHPTRLERFIDWLILFSSVAAGIVAGAMAVQDVIRGTEAKIFLAGVVFFLVAALTYGALTLAVIVLSGFRIRPVRD
jgi:hypothetical protein